MVTIVQQIPAFLDLKINYLAIESMKKKGHPLAKEILSEGVLLAGKEQ